MFSFIHRLIKSKRSEFSFWATGRTHAMRPTGLGGRRRLQECASTGHQGRLRMVVCTFLHTKGEMSVLSVQNKDGEIFVELLTEKI